MTSSKTRERRDEKNTRLSKSLIREAWLFARMNVDTLEYVEHDLWRKERSTFGARRLPIALSSTDTQPWKPPTPGRTAAATTLQIRRALSYSVYRSSVGYRLRLLAKEHRERTRGIQRQPGGRVTRAFSTHLYSTFGGFASARHLKRSSLPSTMRPFLPRPDRILRDTFGA